MVEGAVIVVNEEEDTADLDSGVVSVESTVSSAEDLIVSSDMEISESTGRECESSSEVDKSVSLSESSHSGNKLILDFRYCRSRLTGI